MSAPTSTIRIAIAAPVRSRRHGWGSSLALCCAFVMANSASAADVWVITDQQHPAASTQGARVIELDAPAHIEAALTAQLPSDPARAAATVRQRLIDGGAGLQQRLAIAYQGVADAWSLGVTKVPAVVVDGHYVVYGESDVDRAIARIRAYRSAQPW
jgi:integrating conjugative element protein (TIGR03757 family)